MNNKSHEQQIRYLSQSIRLEEASSPRLMKMTTFAISLSILGFMAWAGFANVNEIAHTPGEIVPSGFQQVVQHLEGGIVKEILAQEGQAVEQGQILLRLDGAGIEEDLKRAQEQGLSLALQEERLRAYIENRAPSYSMITEDRPDLLEDLNSSLASMMDAQQKEKDIIQKQIAQKKSVIYALQGDLQTAKRNQSITNDLYARRQALNQKGVLSDMKLLETEQVKNMADGEVHRLSRQTSVAQNTIAEYQNRLSSLQAGFTDTAHQKLDTVMASLLQNKEILEKLQNRVNRLNIRAPVSGVIKGLSINTIGAIVQPGQVLMEIVPAEAPLIVSLRIPPRYIGHLKAGQNVQVKTSSFDFSRYGSVAGTLDFISATTFDGHNGERYYQGRVSLKKAYIGENPKNILIPGMTVMADIVTGEKTILQYLLKPLRNAINTSFTEK